MDERLGQRVALPVALVAVGLALLVPHAYPSRWVAGGPARVYSGDEPHYLVLLNSVLRDGDLDVANNYRDVHRRGDSAGEDFRDTQLDHHTAWIVDGKYVAWNHIYEMDGAKWPKDAEGFKMPILAPGVDPSMTPTREASYHWPGLALVLAPVLFPLRGTPWLEPATLLCTWLATLFAMLAFVSIARSLKAPTLTTIVAVVLTFLGTPLWNYARALFADPYGAAFLLGAYALSLTGRRMWLAGVLCAIAVLVKATLVVMVAPLGLALLFQKRWRQTLLFGAPLVAALGATLLINYSLFGQLLQGPQGWLPGDVFDGATGLMFSTTHGLLPFAPVVVSALIGWPALVREHRPQAVVALAAAAGLFALTAPYGLWHGGFCYGPRLLLPAIPLIMLGLLTRLRQRPLNPWHCADLVVLGLLSVWINYRGAIPPWAFWADHPLRGLFG